MRRASLFDAFSPQRLWRSFGYAFQGLKYVISHERNFQIHIMAFVLVIMAGYLLGISRSEWCLVVLCVAMVMAAECFNTALEQLVNIVSPDHNLYAGRAKDIAAAAVTITALAAAIVGIIVFLPHIYAFSGQ